MATETLQLGATFLLAMALIELLRFVINKYATKSANELSQKSNDQGLTNNEMTNAIFKELQLMNSNHLTHIERAVNDSNDKMVEAITTGNSKSVEAINNGNLKMVELLGQIVGKLDK